MSFKFKGIGLLEILIRDQAVYFLAYGIPLMLLKPSQTKIASLFSVVFVSLIKIIVDLFHKSTLVSTILEVVGNPALLSIISARLLFNMREAAAKSLNQGMSCSFVQSNLSEIDFAEPSFVLFTELSATDVE